MNDQTECQNCKRLESELTLANIEKTNQLSEISVARDVAEQRVAEMLDLLQIAQTHVNKGEFPETFQRIQQALSASSDIAERWVRREDAKILADECESLMKQGLAAEAERDQARAELETERTLRIEMQNSLSQQQDQFRQTIAAMKADLETARRERDEARGITESMFLHVVFGGEPNDDDAEAVHKAHECVSSLRSRLATVEKERDELVDAVKLEQEFRCQDADCAQRIYLDLRAKLSTVEAHNERLRAALKESANEWSCEEVRANLCSEEGRAQNARLARGKCLAALAPTEGKLNIGAEEDMRLTHLCDGIAEIIGPQNAANIVDAVQQLHDELEAARSAIHQTIGWNESTNGEAEDVRLLHDFLARFPRVITPTTAVIPDGGVEERSYYAIIGDFTRQVIGCCTDQGQKDAMSEDVVHAFHPITKEQYDMFGENPQILKYLNKAYQPAHQNGGEA